MLYIYEIVNQINGKRYIGSTVNKARRKAQHIRQLRNGTHHNGHLQSAWNKYGETNFTFHILGKYDTGDRIKIEQSFIDKYKFSDLYNITKQVRYCKRIHNTQDTCKPVMKMIKNKPVAIYPSISEAARQHKISPRKISDAVNGRRKTVLRHQWRIIETNIFSQG